MNDKLFPEVQMKNRQILQGDVLEQLPKLPDMFYNCIVTSPPYGGSVRDYAVEGQWGLERDPHVYLDRLALFMRQIRRVLTKDGIVWINIGDFIDKNGSWFGIPEMFFSDCRHEGWISVSKLVWFKRNAMPSSTKKRFSPKYEMVYGFAKNPDYYFNLDDVRVPVLTEIKQGFNLRVREKKLGRLEKKYGTKYKATTQEELSHDNLGVKKQDGVGKGNYTGFNGRYDHSIAQENGKNPGDVLDITVKPFKDAHFATFPTALPEVLIRASTPKNGWVLDPFFGSGTVGLVAEQLKLNWTGIELKEDYIKIANKRLKPFIV